MYLKFRWQYPADYWSRFPSKRGWRQAHDAEEIGQQLPDHIGGWTSIRFWCMDGWRRKCAMFDPLEGRCFLLFKRWNCIHICLRRPIRRSFTFLQWEILRDIFCFIWPIRRSFSICEIYFVSRIDIRTLFVSSPYIYGHTPTGAYIYPYQIVARLGQLISTQF